MDFLELEDRFGAHNYHPLPVMVTRGQGCWVWDVHGKKHLDMISAYSAINHGHCHPRILEVLHLQSQKLCVTSRAVYSEGLGFLLQALCELTGLPKALVMNSGAEAVETAIKAARLWGYHKKKIPENQAEIIVAEGNFHGRTTGIISFSSEKAYKAGFGPFLPGFTIIPFGDEKALLQAITDRTCAFLVEPIQGEAGIILPPPGWLKKVSEICKKNNVLLLLDEIQTGLGRTGKMFAYEHEAICPDGLIVGKALGGGVLPVSAFVSREEIMDLFVPGSHGSTFGGNPLAAAVATQAIRVLKEEHLVENSAKLGLYFLEQMRSLKSPAIVDVRGKGLWIGVEFNPGIVSARDFCERLLKKGVIAKDTRDVVVRFAPPLVISKEELDFALAMIRETLEEIGSPSS